MNACHSARGRPSQRVMSQFRIYGALLGGLLGVVVGLLVSGPHFFEWPVSDSLRMIGACLAGGAAVGYLAGSLAPQSAAGAGNAGGGSWSAGGSDGGGFWGSHGDTGGGSDGGGGGDGGGGD